MAAPTFYYVRPDESFTYGTASGTVDADFSAGAVLDGLPDNPAHRVAGLALALTAPASRTVSLLAAVNVEVPGSMAITGGVTGTIPAPTRGADGICFNPWVSVAAVATSTLTMTVAGPATVGELIAGTRRTLTQLLPGAGFGPAGPFSWESGLAPWDPGSSDPRRLSGSVWLTQTGLDEVHAWYASTRRGTRPTLIVPIDTLNDAWLVTFRYNWKYVHGLFETSFEFLELPRQRWAL